MISPFSLFAYGFGFNLDYCFSPAAAAAAIEYTIVSVTDGLSLIK